MMKRREFITLHRRRGSGVAARGACAADSIASDRVHEWQVGRCWFRCCSRIPARAE